MIKGIFGKTYIDLSQCINLEKFDVLHPKICRGFSLAKDLALIGNIDVPKDFMNLDLYENQFKPLFKAHEEFLNLPDNDPIKINGKNLNDNDFSMYLKWVLGGYDLYSFYILYDFKDGWRNDINKRGRTETANYFPEVVSWIDSLIEQEIFSHIGRVIFFVQESGGISFEHKDPSIDPNSPDILSEFIHIRPTLDRPFYIRDSETLEKTYIDTRIGYWNDQDWHGGDPVMKPTYSLRIDGVFTKSFKEKLKNII